VAVSNRHSDRTANRPRRWNRLTPRFALIWPKTDSTDPCLRRPLVFSIAQDKSFRPPKVVAWQRVGTIGAVLFIVRDTRDGHFRSLCVHCEQDHNGVWFAERESGRPWVGDPLDRPRYVRGEPLFDVAGVSASWQRERLVYVAPGQAVQGVTSITCDHRDGPVACPVEPRTGSFIAVGVLDPTVRQFRLAVESNGDQDEAWYAFGSGWIGP
jgi:hypothetical protein